MHEEARMRQITTVFALASTLGVVACMDSPTGPAELVAPSPAPTVASPTAEFRVWGMRWITSDLPPHWVYYWSGGAARRLTVSRISEPAQVVWELVDSSGNGICANARIVNGTCPGGALMHGQVPAGAAVTVDVDPVLSLTPHPPERLYRLSVVLTDGREGSFEFTTYRPWE
jgi:hypothetical protein